MKPGSVFQPPDLEAWKRAATESIFGRLRCHMVGSIVSFDATKQTATVKLAAKGVIYDQPQAIGQAVPLEPTIVDYPLLTDCPVWTMTGGSAFVSMPVAAGDPCLVFFNDRDIDTWYLTGGVEKPNSARMHDLSDGLVLVGFRPLPKAISGYSTTDIVAKNGNGQINVNSDISITADKVTTTASGGNLEVNAQINISNASTSLKTIMDNLITALTGWVDSASNTPNSATVTALNAVKSLSDSLFK